MKEVFRGQPNSPETSLANNISDSETTIYVLNGGLLPDAPNLLVIGGDSPNAETVKLTSKDIDMLVVERGVEGTQKAWNMGTVVARNYTAYDHNTNLDNIDTLNEIKVDKEVGKGLSTNDFTDLEKTKLNGIEEGAEVNKVTSVNNKTGDVNIEIPDLTPIENQLTLKVDKVAGKGLSTNDYTDEEKSKVQGTKIRLENDTFEYFDGVDWVELKGGGSTVPLGNVTNLTVKEDDAQVTLFWKDPDDITVDGIIITQWGGTKIIRKLGSFPSNINDGVVVVDSAIRNQYEINGFTDVGLINNTDYYYMAFPYSIDGLVTSNESNRIKATPTEIKIYGFEIDETNNNPKTAVTYIEDAIGMTPMRLNGGNIDYGSWEDFVKDIAKPVLVKNGVEQYNLNYDDYNLKSIGGASNLTGLDGDVFTRLEHLHMKYEKTTNGFRWYISTKPFDGSVSYTEQLEDGYNQFNNPILVTLQNLYLLLFKDRDSQTALGRGRVDGAGYIESGNTDNKGFFFGSTQDLQVKFLGIEDFYGNKFQWVDGLVSDSNRDLLLGNKNFNDGGSGYTKQTTVATANLSGYFTNVQGGEGGYVLANTDGSETTGYADYGYLHDGRVAYFGGARSYAGQAGAFGCRLDDSASNSYASISARLCFKNIDAVYIGAYLGFEQSGKLRSVSGNLPTDTKTIGQFRTLAKANN